MEQIKQEHRCHITGEVLSGERVEALEMLGVPPQLYTSITTAKRVVQKKRAAFSDGDGGFLIANSLEDDQPMVVEKVDPDLPEVDPSESIPPPPPIPPPLDEELVRKSPEDDLE